MTVSKSFPTQDPGGQPITDTRRVLAGLIARNADGTPRPGILPPVATALVAGRASMAYDVAPFIAATARFNNGIELVANDAVVQVATDPAPNANSRIDVIYVRSRFLQHADGSNLVELAVAKGLAAAIPQKPSIPAGALELGWATVPSTATTTLSNGVVITQTHPFTAAAGGTVWVRNAAEMAAWVAPNGARVLRLDNGSEFERIGGAWVNILAKTPLAIMRRTNAGLLAVNGNNNGGKYTDLSATGAWTATNGVLRGFTYDNGLIADRDGWCEVFWNLWAIGTVGGIAGIAVNAASLPGGIPGGDKLHAIDHIGFKVVSLGSATGRVYLNSGDKLTLWGYGDQVDMPIRGATALEPMHWGARWAAP